ncbi:MAG: phosphoenolpyruvate--protein phosphotransferase [Planctomycetes bacterium]|nr:phosphoenolpyruvate--protein phosphotransferase [Planctomycetota bacterium]
MPKKTDSSSSDRFRRGDGSSDRIAKGEGRPRRKSVFKGVSVVPGIAMGPVRLKFRQTQVLSDHNITFKEVEREYERLNEAVRLSKEQLLEARAKVQKEIGELEAMIFDAHLAILEDQGFLKKIRAQVQALLKPVEVVVAEIVEGYYRLLSMKEAENLRERAADIRDIGRRLLDNLSKLKNPGEEYPAGEEPAVPQDEIIFAREILPSDLVTIEHRHCQAVICETGSGRGHAGVMLRAMNVPTVMGLEGLTENLQDGDFVIVDGSSGTVYVNPKSDIVESFAKTKNEFEHYKTVLKAEVDLPAVTTDGFPIQLLANVSKQSDIDLAKLYNVDGVGLFRSEFHLMVGNSFPDEEEQYWIYRQAVEKMAGRPVTIRTMDLGSDKKLPYIKLPDDETHGLGRRSIRLVPELEEFQLIQLRAILRASVHGKVRLMWPFITSLEDIRLGKRLVRQARRDLDLARKKYDADMPVGMMVEVPAAALSLDKYVRDAAFFSVGTNDLTQYVCAADRNSADVAPWFKGHNPGMLALLKLIVDTMKTHNGDLTICGEMAGDPFYTMFLLGLGVTKLSMPAPQVPLVKKIIRSVNLSGATNLANRALQTTSTSQIRELFATTVQQILGRDLGGWTRTSAE